MFLYLAVQISAFKIKRTCLKNSQNCECDCDDSDGFLVFTYKNDLKNKFEIQISWIEDRIIVQCSGPLERYNFEIDIYIKVVEFQFCIIDREISEIFPFLNKSNVDTLRGVSYKARTIRTPFLYLPNIRVLELNEMEHTLKPGEKPLLVEFIGIPNLEKLTWNIFRGEIIISTFLKDLPNIRELNVIEYHFHKCENTSSKLPDNSLYSF